MQANNNSKIFGGLASLVVAVTGHRDLDRATVEPVLDKMIELLKHLADSYPHTPILVITGMAEGADQLAVEAVERLRARAPYASRIDYRPVLPMPEKQFVLEFTTEGGENFRQRINGKTHTTLPVHPCHTLDQIAELHSAARRQQYCDLADFLVKACQILIAVWDGKPGKPGGTSEVVNRKLGKYRPYEQAHICEKERYQHQMGSYGMGINSFGLGPVYHITAQRAEATDVSPDEAAEWKYPDGEADEDNEARAKAFAQVYLLLDEYNRDVLSHPQLAAKARKKFNDETGSAVVAHCTPGMLWTAAMRSWAATLASHYKTINDRILKAVYLCLTVSAIAVHLTEPLPKYRVYATVVYYLGATGAILLWSLENGWSQYGVRRSIEFAQRMFKKTDKGAGTDATSTDNPDNDATDNSSTGSFDIVKFGPLAQRMPRAGLKFRRKHEDYRALSEALRIQYYWLASGIQHMASENYLDKHAGDMVWVRDATSDTMLYQYEVRPNGPSSDILSHSLASNWIEVQLRYFRNHSGDGERKHLITYLGGLGFFLLGFFGPGTYLSMVARYQHLIDWHESLLAFGPSFTMLCAVLIWNYGELKGYEEEAQQYRQMEKFFERADKRLRQLLQDLTDAERADPVSEQKLQEAKEAIREFLRHIGRGALAENGDWMAMHRGRDLKISLGTGA